MFRRYKKSLPNTQGKIFEAKSKVAWQLWSLIMCICQDLTVLEYGPFWSIQGLKGLILIQTILPLVNLDVLLILLDRNQALSSYIVHLRSSPHPPKAQSTRKTFYTESRALHQPNEFKINMVGTLRLKYRGAQRGECRWSGHLAIIRYLSVTGKCSGTVAYMRKKQKHHPLLSNIITSNRMVV